MLQKSNYNFEPLPFRYVILSHTARSLFFHEHQYLVISTDQSHFVAHSFHIQPHPKTKEVYNSYFMQIYSIGQQGI